MKKLHIGADDDPLHAISIGVLRDGYRVCSSSRRIPDASCATIPETVALINTMLVAFRLTDHEISDGGPPPPQVHTNNP